MRKFKIFDLSPLENLINAKLQLKHHLYLKNAKLDKDNLALALDFVYPETVNGEDKTKVYGVVKGNVPEYIKEININIKRLYFNEEILENFVLKSIDNKYPVLSAAIDKNLKINNVNGSYKITIKCDESAIDYTKKFNTALALANDLKAEFFENFTIIFEQANLISEKDIVIEEETEPVLNKRLIKVSNAEALCGLVAGDCAFYIGDIKQIMSPCVICGKVSNIAKRTTKNDKVMFTFDITDFTGKMRCLYFPIKKYIDKFELLKDGSEVLLGGSIKEDNYNGGLCMTVRNVSLCRLPCKEEFKIEMPAAKKEQSNYKTVTPQKVMQFTQDSLFETHTVNNYFLNKFFVVFDIETTGLRVEENAKITEIGAVKIFNGIITEKFSTLIDPEISIPQSITDLTGITDEMVKGKPKIEEVLPDFFKFTRNCILVAHNIDFDFGFIRAFAQKQGYFFENEILDTLALGRKKLPGLSNYKLQTLAGALKVPLLNHHRAVDDAEACAGIFLKLNA